MECICCTVWLQCLGKPKGSEQCFAVHYISVRAFSSKQPFFSFFLSFLQVSSQISAVRQHYIMCVSLGFYTQPASKSSLFLLAPLGAPYCCWRTQIPSAGQRGEIPLNSPEFSLQPPLVKECNLLADHLPRSLHWWVITLLC